MADDTMTGYLFEDAPRLQPIRPDSWLNDPRHDGFASAYGFALTHLNTLAARAFDGMTPEQVYLVWKTVETAFAGIQRRSGMRLPR